MARWGGESSVPYFAELLELETFDGSEAIYEVLSESSDPRAAEAIARRVGNFFDGKRALAALRRMGPAAEPGLILAVASEDFDVSLVSVKLLEEYGTEESLPILNEAVRKGVPAVRVAARSAMAKIRARQRKAARAGAK
jgi:HEAT repeat protein